MRPIVATVGPVGTAAKPAAASTSAALIRLDEWGPPGVIGVAVVATGTSPSYSVQYSYDDPNSPTNPVAVGSMTWEATGIAAATGSTAATTIAANPLWLQLVAATGPGTVSLTATIVQMGVAPY